MYHVIVTELRYGNVFVEAKTEEDAKNVARKMWKNDEVCWNDQELTDLSVEGVLFKKESVKV